MKRIDYFWPRAAVQITGIVFFTQVILEISGLAQRKTGLEWVLPVCAGLFAASVAWTLYAIIKNAVEKVLCIKENT